METASITYKQLSFFGEAEPLSEAPDQKRNVHHMSESEEWYTPAEIIALALDVLGTIDLDPCAAPDVHNVPANHYFTRADCPLYRRWWGKCWVNPPYGRAILTWTGYLIHEYEHGLVSEALLLVPARPGSKWMKKLRPYWRCDIEGRLHFSGAKAGAPFPSRLIYMGHQEERFLDVFSPIGDCSISYAKPKNDA